MSARYCVIGNPVGHSRSPEIHAAFARATGIALTYERCLAPLDGFGATVAALVQQGYGGANVTVPFKLEAAALADTLTERARAAGAVNTLSFIDGRVEGDNTDGAGLVNDIVHNAGVPLAGRRILLLGAGGAVRGALLPLLAEGPAALVIANRTVATAAALAAQCGAANAAANVAVNVAASAFDAIDGSFDVVINATSASLAAQMPPIPAHVFAKGALALDMMYGATPSPFMTFASDCGATARDGLGMLVEQAAVAFAVWRRVMPPTGDVLQQLRSSL